MVKNIVVYSPESNCPRCTMAKRMMKSKGVEFEERVADDQKIEEFRAEQLGSFPVIKVLGENGETIKTITGLDTTSISALPTMMAVSN